MKNSTLIVLVLAGSVMVICSPLLAQNLQLEAKLSPRFLPYSAVPVEITLSNTHTAPISILNISNVPDVLVVVESVPSGTNYYTGPLAITRAVSDGLQGDFPRAVVAPGSSYVLSQLLRCRWDATLAKPIFTEPGRFRIQFSYRVWIAINGLRTNIAPRSQWMEFEVVRPEDRETVAVTKVSTNPFAGLFLYPEDIHFLGKPECNHLEQEAAAIVKEFPESYLTPYAQFALAGVHEARALKNSGRSKENELRLASVELDALIGKTNFALASEVQSKRKRTRALLGLPDDTPPPSQAPTVSPVSSPTNPLVTATSELTALRYDVRGFQRDNPARSLEHMNTVLQLNDEMGQGRISREQFDRQRADLLRQYMTNYSTPLSLEEWNRRQEQYAREDAERRKQEDAQRPNPLEVERLLRENRNK